MAPREKHIFYEIKVSPLHNTDTSIKQMKHGVVNINKAWTTVHTSYVRQRHSVLEDDGPYFLYEAATVCLFLRTTVHTFYVRQRHSVCS